MPGSWKLLTSINFYVTVKDISYLPFRIRLISIFPCTYGSVRLPPPCGGKRFLTLPAALARGELEIFRPGRVGEA